VFLLQLEPIAFCIASRANALHNLSIGGHHSKSVTYIRRRQTDCWKTYSKCKTITLLQQKATAPLLTKSCLRSAVITRLVSVTTNDQLHCFVEGSTEPGNRHGRKREAKLSLG